MPDESWNLTDTAYTADALLLAGAKSASDGLGITESPLWAEAWPFADGVTATDNQVVGLPLSDGVTTADALLLAGAKSASDGLDTAEAFAWQGGVVLTDNVYTVDAFAVFERVIWKLTLGRW